MARQQVRMTIPSGHDGVHDGLGNIHKPHTTPWLASDIAATFVQKNFAVYVEMRPKRFARELMGRWVELEYRNKLATIGLVFGILGLFIKLLRYH